jgi:threonine dehydrogenase-like Zn-dependent dehydrogenase
MGSDLERTMEALRLQPGAGKETVERIAVPTIGPEGVLVKVKAAGIAPGVLSLGRAGLLQALPATLGHEISGVVEAVGDQVPSTGPAAVKVGSRVRIHSNLSCRSCEYCLFSRDQMCFEASLMGFQVFGKRISPLVQTYRDGGLAEYVRAPYWLVDELPDNVNFDVGAKLHEIATALCTLRQADLKPGATVIVTAPTGAVGSCLLKLAEFFSIYRLVLIGRSTERLELVKKLSKVKTDIIAVDQLSPEWVIKKELARTVAQTIPLGADAFIDLTPGGTELWQSLAGLKTGGTMVHLGGNAAPLPLPMVAIMTNCWKIVGIRNHSRNDALTVLSWLGEGRLNADDLITHKWEFKEIETAIERIRDRSLPIWMCVINF